MADGSKLKKGPERPFMRLLLPDKDGNFPELFMPDHLRDLIHTHHEKGKAQVWNLLPPATMGISILSLKALQRNGVLRKFGGSPEDMRQELLAVTAKIVQSSVSHPLTLKTNGFGLFGRAAKVAGGQRYQPLSVLLNDTEGVVTAEHGTMVDLCNRTAQGPPQQVLVSENPARMTIALVGGADPSKSLLEALERELPPTLSFAPVDHDNYAIS